MSSDEKPTLRTRRARAKRDDAPAPDAPAAEPSREDARDAVEGDAKPVATARAHDETVTRPLIACAAAAAIGLAVVGTSAHPVGPWVLSAGVIGLVASIHRLGRLGPA